MEVKSVVYLYIFIRCVYRRVFLLFFESMFGFVGISLEILQFVILNIKKEINTIVCHISIMDYFLKV